MVKIEYTFKVNLTIVIILIVMWLGVMVFFYLKADEVTHNACQICAKQVGEKVVCQITGKTPIEEKTFYPNFTESERTIGG